jgi:hypothetical protein
MMAAMTSATAVARLPRAAANGWIGSPRGILLDVRGALGRGSAGGQLGFSLAAVPRVFVAIAWSRSLTSTTWMVLFSPLLAAERLRRRAKFIWIPLAITLGSFALGIFVAGWQRFPASGRFGPELWGFGAYISLFWVLHFWHFGNQDFGVLTLYRGRAGQARLLDRKLDKAYTVVMMFLIQPVIYLCVVKTTAFSELARGVLPLSDGLLGRGARRAGRRRARLARHRRLRAGEAEPLPGKAALLRRDPAAPVAAVRQRLFQAARTRVSLSVRLPVEPLADRDRAGRPHQHRLPKPRRLARPGSRATLLLAGISGSSGC